MTNKRSKNNIENYYEKLKNEFTSYTNEVSLKEYNDIEKIYNDIREYYKEKIKNKEINLSVEKIRLERSLGKHSGAGFSYSIAFIIAIAGGIFSSIIQQIIKIVEMENNFKTSGIVISIFVLLGVYLYAIFALGKDLNKYKPRDVMLNISLKVIEELEKEMNENKAIQEKEVNREKTIEQIKQHIDSANTIKNTVLPVMAEIAATSIVRKGIISKLIRKMRKE
ncbi:hypothetical protein JOC70_000723 [Clostridium pascui]|uniref:hypothetical protein n=1 Tax=Clostridium pascui TaxID=46609 RepID=UPI001958018D|nr:hypothetical protein [Clostridium pascui]MBM7869254.1 hypothetical protein [Clostridium pascui]